MSGEWKEIVLEDCISEIIDFNFGMEPVSAFTQDQHPDLAAFYSKTVSIERCENSFTRQKHDRN